MARGGRCRLASWPRSTSRPMPPPASVGEQVQQLTGLPARRAQCVARMPSNQWPCSTLGHPRSTAAPKARDQTLQAYLGLYAPAALKASRHAFASERMTSARRASTASGARCCRWTNCWNAVVRRSARSIIGRARPVPTCPRLLAQPLPCQPPRNGPARPDARNHRGLRCGWRADWCAWPRAPGGRMPEVKEEEPGGRRGTRRQPATRRPRPRAER
jgi:hypothetical protein